jgi:hypothetical protein
VPTPSGSRSSGCFSVHLQHARPPRLGRSDTDRDERRGHTYRDINNRTYDESGRHTRNIDDCANYGNGSHTTTDCDANDRKYHNHCSR